MGIIFVLAVLIVSAIYGFPFIASAVYWVLAGIAICMLVYYLVVTGLATDKKDPLRKWRLVTAMLIVAYAGAWLLKTKMIDTPSTSTASIHQTV